MTRAQLSNGLGEMMVAWIRAIATDMVEYVMCFRVERQILLIVSGYKGRRRIKNDPQILSLSSWWLVVPFN